MTTVAAAYCLFRFELDSSFFIEIIYGDRTKKTHPISLSKSNTKSKNIEPDEKFFANALIEGKERVLEILNKSSMNDFPIALACPDEWRLAISKAFRSIRIEEFDVFDRGVVEAFCFYDYFEKCLQNLFFKWIEKCRTEPSIAKHAKLSLLQLEEKQASLRNKRMTVAVVGAMKAGKSTFLNALLGQFVLPAMDKRCTRRRFTLCNADEKGEGRRVDVFLLKNQEFSQKSGILSVDADKLGWTSEHLRSYLFALNSPNLLGVTEQQLDPHEKMFLDSFRCIPFKSAEERELIHKALKREAASIDYIRLTHPFYSLPQSQIGTLELWDTPGPNAIEEEAQEEKNEQRYLSDRESFQSAVKDSNALLVIFDVMQQEAEAQDEVLKIVSERRSGTSSVLVIANKVDLRPKRNVLPIENLLDEIQRQAQERHGMVLRPPLPTSSRPAQLARELIRSGDATQPELLEEYESIERPEDRRRNPNEPARAVEERSNILKTEELLKRFFRQEPGRAVLVDGANILLKLLEENRDREKQILFSQKADQEKFKKAALSIEKGRSDLHFYFEKRLNELNTTFQRAVSNAKEQNQKIVQSVISTVRTYWEEVFGRETKIQQHLFDEKKMAALQKATPSFDETNDLLESMHQQLVLEPFLSLWDDLQDQLKRIETAAAQELGVKIEKKTSSNRLIFDKATLHDPNVSIETVKKKDTRGRETAIAGGAAVGLGAGAIAVGLALATGPIGWLAGAAVLLGGGIGGAGVGAGVHHVNAEEISEHYVSKKDVLEKYTSFFHEIFEHLFQINFQQLEQKRDEVFKSIQEYAKETLRQLDERLESAQKLVRDPNRLQKIEKIEAFLQDVEKDLHQLKEIAERLGTIGTRDQS